MLGGNIIPFPVRKAYKIAILLCAVQSCKGKNSTPMVLKYKQSYKQQHELIKLNKWEFVEDISMRNGMCLSKGILWVLIWFGFMLLYTTLDVTVWRKIDPLYGKYLNLFFIIFCMVVFLLLLTKKNNFKIDLLINISFQGILLALVCAGLFYLLQ